MKTERDQEGTHNPREGRPKAAERGKRSKRDKPASSCHGRGRSEAVDTLTMRSHGVEISIAGGRVDEKDEEVVTLTPLIYTANSFWSVGQPQLIQRCGSVSMDLTLLVSTQPHSHTVLLRHTNAGATGRC